MAYWQPEEVSSDDDLLAQQPVKRSDAVGAFHSFFPLLRQLNVARPGLFASGVGRVKFFQYGSCESRFNFDFFFRLYRVNPPGVLTILSSSLTTKLTARA